VAEPRILILLGSAALNIRDEPSTSFGGDFWSRVVREGFELATFSADSSDQLLSSELSEEKSSNVIVVVVVPFV